MEIYDYAALQKDLDAAAKIHPSLTPYSIGKSCNGRELYCVRLGHGEKTVMCNAAHHGLEWITAKLMTKFILGFAECRASGAAFGGRVTDDLCASVSMYIIPMVNPDGVEISKEVKNWQSNARGVDLNHNYDAGWAQYKALAAEAGITVPTHTRYPGERAESEPESKVLADFTRLIRPDYVLAFHSQGEVIYWQYAGFTPPNAREAAERLSAASGYALDVADGLSSYSGYKDWFISEFNKPGFTIEVGRGVNPIPIEQTDEIYTDVLKLMIAATELK